MNIYLVRHGQSTGNKNSSEYFKKLDCDIELTKKGYQDAKNAAKRIKFLQFSSFIGNVYSSPYVRAKETAKTIMDNFTMDSKSYINDYIESPLLREREWGGLRDIIESGQKTEHHFNFFYRPLNGESFADCFHRAATFDNWLMLNATAENNIIVAHGEFIKLYLMHKLNWTIEEFNSWRTPKNGEVFLLQSSDSDDKKFKLSALTPLTERHIKKI